MLHCSWMIVDLSRDFIALACRKGVLRFGAFVTKAGRNSPYFFNAGLFDDGVRQIAQKVGEEGVETALAAVVQDDEALLGESADLLFHLAVLLRARGLALHDAIRVLEQRHRK